MTDKTEEGQAPNNNEEQSQAKKEEEKEKTPLKQSKE